ncbi:DUF4238 domain-containing protein [Prosthecomicrobium hirschii]|uniref:DUF4238 domain-containing protein n=1 Tax=Prosthecodimorpha hirschii TaxID=665126 RepID=UPI0009F9A8C8|nr:DUF4238 domain-containing protein [Prosthecomicrobium hirschii]
MNQSSTSQVHHYVPKFLLENWIEDESTGHISGYWWNSRTNGVYCKKKGAKGFCCERGLYPLSKHELGVNAIESEFFQKIDSKAGSIIDKVKHGQTLDKDEKIMFASFVLSLKGRRPNIAATLRNAVPELILEELDSNMELIDTLEEMNIQDKPSELIRRKGVNLEDRSIAMIQRISTPIEVIMSLSNSSWCFREFKDIEESLAISDNPLIAFNGYESKKSSWLLPISPRILFIASHSSRGIRRAQMISDINLIRMINEISITQIDRFLISEERNADWIKWRLPLTRHFRYA